MLIISAKMVPRTITPGSIASAISLMKSFMCLLRFVQCVAIVSKLENFAYLEATASYQFATCCVLSH